MPLERAELVIKEGLEADFAAAMDARGKALLAGIAGVRSVSLGRGVENPAKFMLLVDWETMDAHAAAKDGALNEFRQLIMPFSAGGSMEHFEMG